MLVFIITSPQDTVEDRSPRCAAPLSIYYLLCVECALIGTNTIDQIRSGDCHFFKLVSQSLVQITQIGPLATVLEMTDEIRIPRFVAAIKSGPA